MLNCYSKKCFTGIIILMLILAKAGYAQKADTTGAAASKTSDFVTGVVVDQDNRPVEGAKVTIKGQATSVTTGVTGHFEIDAPSGSVLVFTYANHYTNQVTVKTKVDKISVRLLDSYLQVRDKVDVLYGTVDKASLLGSVATIYTNQLTTTPASLYVYALPGQLAGLYTQQNSGFAATGNQQILGTFFSDVPVVVNTHGIAPTDNTEIGISVRGHGGVTTIIDGVQREISSIDPESIESISILKDALSTSLLGINSSKAVLMVTTKKPEIGAPRISFTTEAGVQQSQGLPTDALPAYQWAYLYNEAALNDGNPALYKASDIALYKDHSDPYGHPDVDWKSVILKDYAPIQSDKLNVSGGTEAARYNISLNYFDQGGIFKEAASVPYSTNNNLSRYTLNSSISVNVNKNLTVDLQLYGKIQQSIDPGAGYGNILQAVESTPNNAYPVYNPNNTFGGSSLGGNYTNNLLSRAQYSGYTLTKVHDVLANLDLDYNLGGFVKGLSFKGKGNVAIESQVYIDRTLQNLSYTYLRTSDTTVAYNSTGTARSQNNSFNTVLSSRYSFAQASLDYQRSFGKNNITAQAFYDTRSLAVSYDIAAITTNTAFKAAYNYDGKYFVEGTVDNSSFNEYAPGHQKGWFYAGGIGWQMGKEDFIKDLAWISSWKWRATYGQTGNDNVGYYVFKQTYTGSGNVYPQGLNHAGGSGYTESSPIANPDITWEKAHKLDIGTDISFLHDQLQLTADYYHESYYDLLGTRGATVALFGAAYPTENIGNNLYTGEELSLTYRNHAGDFNYFITGNGNIAKSKVVYFDEEPTKYPWQARTGQAVGVTYGYHALGFYTATDVNNHAATINGYTAQPGDIKYEDLNKDGVIDQYDQEIIAGNKPLVYYGTTLGFNYRGLSFSVILQGVFNRDLNLNNNNIINGFTGTQFPFGLGAPVAPYGQAYQASVHRWTPETANTATLPRLSLSQVTNTENNNNNTATSSFYIKSGNYFRVKNAEIGYTLPNRWSNKLKLAGVRLFVNGENLFTIAGYRGWQGFDPEVNGFGAYPLQRVFNAGLTVKL